MKHLKTYNESKNNEVDDILLPFIDDNKCRVERSENLVMYSFRDNPSDYERAISRLEKFNTENYFVSKGEYRHIIFWYSDELKDFFIDLIAKCHKLNINGNTAWMIGPRINVIDTNDEIYIRFDIYDHLLLKCMRSHYYLDYLVRNLFKRYANYNVDKKDILFYYEGQEGRILK